MIDQITGLASDVGSLTTDNTVQTIMYVALIIAFLVKHLVLDNPKYPTINAFADLFKRTKEQVKKELISTPSIGVQEKK